MTIRIILALLGLAVLVVIALVTVSQVREDIKITQQYLDELKHRQIELAKKFKDIEDTRFYVEQERKNFEREKRNFFNYAQTVTPITRNPATYE